MKVASFFAGVGGIDLGFKKAGFEVIWANEIDKYAMETFRQNFECQTALGDINNIKTKDIPKFDIMIAGFPCQAFSLAGYRKGFEDERGELFFQLIRIIRDKKPKIVFLENVKNLVSHDKGNTFKVIKEALKEKGYELKHQILNAKDYGIPQNRERIYIVGFLDKKKAEKFKIPKPVKLSKDLADVIDFDGLKDEKYYYRRDKQKFYDKLEEAIKGKHTLYQWRRQYVRENKSNLSPTLTANMGTGGHNVPLIYTDNGIRKLPPRECFNLQGYPRNIKIQQLVSDAQLYKQAGNSVVVPVIEKIAKEIKKVL